MLYPSVGMVFTEISPIIGKLTAVYALLSVGKVFTEISPIASKLDCVCSTECKYGINDYVITL